MRSEHRAPLVASIVVVLACIGVMAHAVRTDALGGFARHTPMGMIAGTVLQPKPQVGDAAPAAPVVAEKSKAPADRGASAPESRGSAKPDGGHATSSTPGRTRGGTQGQPQSHIQGHQQPVGGTHSGPRPPDTKVPDTVSVPMPTPMPTTAPTPSSVPTPSPMPSHPGRGPGYGPGPGRDLGHAITSAITSALTRDSDNDIYGHGNESDDRSHGRSYDHDHRDGHWYDDDADHRGGRDGHRSWR